MRCVIFFFFFLFLYQYIVFFFFFQAEDGIRDKLVTGVQTCALPISSAPPTPRHSRHAAWSGCGSRSAFPRSAIRDRIRCTAARTGWPSTAGPLPRPTPTTTGGSSSSRHTEPPKTGCAAIPRRLRSHATCSEPSRFYHDRAARGARPPRTRERRALPRVGE